MGDFMFDYIVIAFFAAFLGLKYVQTKATGHLWFLLPLLLILGLNQGWGNIFKGESFGEAFFLFYRLLTLASCFFACYMYFRDYRKREAVLLLPIAKNRRRRKKRWNSAKNKRKAVKQEKRNKVLNRKMQVF